MVEIDTLCIPIRSRLYVMGNKKVYLASRLVEEGRKVFVASEYLCLVGMI